ncbi:MAG TPA: hypothetical protein PLV25_05985, partial [Opitutales bacterium]|nr:hypothetical protein [Opitutales bacterium]
MNPIENPTKLRADTPAGTQVHRAPTGSSPTGRAVQTSTTSSAYAANLGAAPAQPPPASTTRTTTPAATSTGVHTHTAPDSPTAAVSKPPLPENPFQSTTADYLIFREILDTLLDEPPLVANSAKDLADEQQSIAALVSQGPPIPEPTDYFSTLVNAILAHQPPSSSSTQERAVSPSIEAVPAKPTPTTNQLIPSSKAPATPLKEEQTMAISRAQSAGRMTASRKRPLRPTQELQDYYLNKYPNSALSEDQNRALAELYARQYTASFNVKAQTLAAGPTPNSFKDQQSQANRLGGDMGRDTASHKRPPTSTQALQDYYLNKYTNSTQSEDQKHILAKTYADAYIKSYVAKAQRMTTSQKP